MTHATSRRDALVSLRGRPEADLHEVIPYRRPTLLSMRVATTAMILGRVAIVGAALLVAVAARRTADGSRIGDSFWPFACAAALGGAGVLGTSLWTARLAENARRLAVRASTPAAAGLSWLLPIVWAALASATFLRIDVGGGFDPLPAVAALGFAVTLAVPVGRLQGVFRGMTRRPPVLWWNVWWLDWLAFGAIWWRLTSWPDPASAAELERAEMTSNVCVVAAGVLTASALVYGWLGLRGVQSIYERLGRIEARHRRDRNTGPEWFHSGFRPSEARSSERPPPLVDTRTLTTIVSGAHALWGVLAIVWSALLVTTAIGRGGRFTLVDITPIEARDLELFGDAASILLVGLVVVAVVHGAWGVLAIVDAGRVTVHAPHPVSIGVPFAAVPALVLGGSVAGGAVGDGMVIAGVVCSLAALVRLHLVVLTLVPHVGGGVQGFGRWTWLLFLVYVIALANRFAIPPSSGRLVLHGVSVFTQGVLVLAGAAVGARAMRGLERALETRWEAKQAPGFAAVT